MSKPLLDFTNIDTIISRERIDAYHKGFDKIKQKPWLKKWMFLKMHANRVKQSAYIVLSNPLLWGHILKGFINAIKGKRALLRSLEIAVTYRCNARCEQCSCRLEMVPDRERHERMTAGEFKKAIDQAVELGAFQFCINGGEPMLEEETVNELTQHIKKHHKRYVHLCSNGYLLDKKKLMRLKKSGLDSLEMGFDSADAYQHDNNRMKGSFSKILENIKTCHELGILVILNTVLTNDKVRSDDIIRTIFIAKKAGCLLQITPCCLTGAFKNRIDLMLTDDAKLYFHYLLSINSNNRSDLYSSLTKIKCPAAREKIGLQPYGDIVSCPLIQIKYGNIRNTSLKEAQQEMLKNPFYSLKECEGCLPAMSKEFIENYLFA